MDDNTEESRDVVICVGLPDSIHSYAGGQLPEGGLSNLGGAYNVDASEYDLRYIMEAWTDETTGRMVCRKIVTVDEDFVGSSVKFTARLPAMEYNLVFWADFVPQGTIDDFVYATSSDNGLQEIVLSSEGRQAGNEFADAYYASNHVDLTASGLPIGKIVLSRPFGKIRMIATDAVDGQLEDRPGHADVSYGAGMTLPDTFNALTGRASGNVPAGEYMFNVYQETAVVDGYDSVEGAFVLGTDYIFASDAVTSYSFDVEVFSSVDNSSKIGSRELSQIPLEKNKLTTVIGNFYSSERDVKVVVSDEFEKQ